MIQVGKKKNENYFAFKYFAIFKSPKMDSHYFSYLKMFHKSIVKNVSFCGIFTEHFMILNTKTINRCVEAK